MNDKDSEEPDGETESRLDAVRNRPGDASEALDRRPGHEAAGSRLATDTEGSETDDAGGTDDGRSDTTVRDRIQNALPTVRSGRPGESTANDVPGPADDSREATGRLSRLLPGVLRKNLLGKLFAGLFVILLVSGATASFFYLDMDNQLDDQVNTQVRETANLQADVYQSWFGDREQELTTIGGFVSGNREVQTSYLDSSEKQSDNFRALHIVSLADGEILASSHRSVIGESLYETVNEDQVSGRNFVTQMQYSSLTNGTVIGIGNPLSTRQGEILLGEVNATSGGPVVRQTTEGSRTFVVNANGDTVLGSESIDESIVNGELEDMTVIEQNGSLVASSGLDNDLFMVTQSPADEAFALREDILRSFLITLLVTFIVLSVIIGAGGRSIQKSLTDLARQARLMEEGDLSVGLSTGREDEIGTLYGSFEAMRDSLRERITQAEEALEDAEQAKSNAETARQEAETARRQAQEVNEQIKGSADRYSDVMEDAANGDLTGRMAPDEENEAMAAIADDFNEMIAEFETIVGEVTQFADQVSTASEGVTASSQEVRSASEQVSQAIQQISEGAVEQNDSLQAVTAEMNDLSATVEEIAASSDQVAQVAEETATTSRDGRSAAQDAIDGMETVREESRRAVEEIEALESQVEQVDELIARISDIADQTSILALNANIEAARAGAGSDGDGFEVVAQEVKTLSEDAKRAADQVEDRLEAIRTQTERSAQAVQTTSDGIEEHTGSVEQAAEALAGVADQAEKTNTGVQDISTSTDQQAKTTDQVVSMVDEVAEIAERTTTEAENTTATAEEQTAAMAEVSESAAELSDQAMQLSGALDRFRTEADVTADATDD